MSTAGVVDSVVRGIDDDLAQRVRRGNLLRVAHNAKRDNGAANVNRPVAYIEFTEAYSTTAAGEQFLLYDSRPHERGLEPFFIFASATGIRSLREARNWGSDGRSVHFLRWFKVLVDRYVRRCTSAVRFPLHSACYAGGPFGCLRRIRASA